MESEVEYPQEVLSWEECTQLLDRFPELSVEERAVSIRQLVRNPSPGIRQRALQIGAEVFSEEELTSFLRSEVDDVVRNMGLEILKLQGQRATPLALKLLHDPDPDVIMQAILALDSIADPATLEPLQQALQSAANDNVAQAAILAVGHVGGPGAVTILLPYLKANDWLRTAAIDALGNTGSEDALKHLKRLLKHPFAGTFAAASIARIGGRKACTILAQSWMKSNETMTLEFLNHALAQLKIKPPKIKGLEEALVRTLDSEDDSERISAVHCLIALGSNNPRAYALLAETGSPEQLPESLSHRKDLASLLLQQSGTLRNWGVLLAAKHPDIMKKRSNAVLIPLLARAATEAQEPTADLLDLLAQLKRPEISEALLELYLHTPEENRAIFESAFLKHRKEIRKLLPDRDLLREAYIVIAATAGEAVGKLARLIVELSDDQRLSVLPQVMHHVKLVKKLPWKKWLVDSPSAYAEMAADAINNADMKQLIATLRKQLHKDPAPELIRAVAQIGDGESVPFLVSQLGKGNQLTDALVVESLGKIGGDASRDALRTMVTSPESKDNPLALRALAQCAQEQDTDIFREASTHHDWRIRFACAEVLSRFRGPQNEEALARLSADPSAIVAQKARS